MITNASRAETCQVRSDSRAIGQAGSNGGGKKIITWHNHVGKTYPFSNSTRLSDLRALIKWQRFLRVRLKNPKLSSGERYFVMRDYRQCSPGTAEANFITGIRPSRLTKKQLEIAPEPLKIIFSRLAFFPLVHWVFSLIFYWD